jgi:hypothetical protein
MSKELLPREKFIITNIPHPKPLFWCKGLVLPPSEFSEPVLTVCTGVPTVQAPSAPHLGNCLDLRGNPYYKKLEVGDIIYNPYQKLVAKVIKWKSRLCQVKVYASFKASDIHYDTQAL